MKVIEQSNAPLPRRAFTIKEVAEQFGVAVDSIYRAIYSGKLKPLSGFGRKMISDRELERFLGQVREV